MVSSQAIVTCFRKYMAVKGVASRSECGWFHLLSILISCVCLIEMSVIPVLRGLYFDIPNLYRSTGILVFLFVISSIMTFIPLVALSVIRLHYVNKR